MIEIVPDVSGIRYMRYGEKSICFIPVSEKGCHWLEVPLTGKAENAFTSIQRETGKTRQYLCTAGPVTGLLSNKTEWNRGKAASVLLEGEGGFLHGVWRNRNV